MVLLCPVPEPPQVVRHPQPQTATSGRSVRFMVLVSGVPPPQVSWYKDSEALFSGPKHKFLHDEQEHTLLLLDTSPEDVGVYSCQAQNEYGEDTSSALLTVEGTKPKGVCVYFGQTMRLLMTCVFSPMPEVVSMTRVSAPMLLAPMQDVLVSEGHPAHFQCSISGEGRLLLLSVSGFLFSR